MEKDLDLLKLSNGRLIAQLKAIDHELDGYKEINDLKVQNLEKQVEKNASRFLSRKMDKLGHRMAKLEKLDHEVKK